VNRFVSAALLFGVILVPCIGACTAIGVGYRASARNVRGLVPASSLGDVPEDAYVSVESPVRLLHKREFPLRDGMSAVDDGAALYALDGAPGVLVYCKDEDCVGLVRARERIRVDGRLCPTESSFFGCRLSPAPTVYLDDRGARTSRVLLAGESPTADKVNMALAFAFAGLDALVYAGAVVLVATRRRKGPARVSLDLAIQAPLDGEGVRGRIKQRLAGADAFRVESEGPTSLVFAQGLTEDRGRMLGLTHFEEVPRRAAITWVARPYHPTLVSVRLTEEVAWITAFSPPLEAMCRAALARTAEQVGAALRA
jgi:hypothetical protein